MTHYDIYTKFMIEYDKANVTSSYPSLTEYEVATVLDKAYNALIAQKVTGNNVRRMPFEADIKSISDLQPLVVRYNEKGFEKDDYINNQLHFSLPEDFLYYVGCYINGESNIDIHPQTKKIFAQNINIAGDVNHDGVIDVADKTAISDIMAGRYPQYDGDVNRDGVVDSADITTIGDMMANLSSTTVPTCAFVLNTEYNKQCVSKITFDEYLKKETTWNCAQLNNNDQISNNRSVTVDELINYINQWGSLCKSIAIWPDSYVFTSNYITVQSRDVTQNNDVPYDANIERSAQCQIVDFNTAQKFFVTQYNMPWVKNPVCYIQDKTIYVVHDAIPKYDIKTCSLVYIKKPLPFAGTTPTTPIETDYSWFDPEVGDENIIGGKTEFELNSTMAEELISLAIAYALENVESPRLNSKLNMRGLEA